MRILSVEFMKVYAQNFIHHNRMFLHLIVLLNVLLGFEFHKDKWSEYVKRIENCYIGYADRILLYETDTEALLLYFCSPLQIKEELLAEKYYYYKYIPSLTTTDMHFKKYKNTQLILL